MESTPPNTRDPSPRKNARADPSSQHLTRASVISWKRTRQLLSGEKFTIDGQSLDIAGVLAVAKYGVSATLAQDAQTSENIKGSVEMLKVHLEHGHLVYGVTTGFGGSADTRTTDLESLQRALVQHQNSGILTSHDIGRPQSIAASSHTLRVRDVDAGTLSNSMPTSWVRASMLIRCNSMIRGHSAVRVIVAETILELLNRNIIPVVPLRGSISASGDLSPLSYIAGAIEGSSDIFVRCGDEIVTAAIALKRAGIQPITLGPKEGLGLLNGTAFSAATACIALHQALDVAVLSQVLTAMAVEALRGSAESFWPQIARMRPHPGQIESAANILAFLQGSKLARCVKEAKDTKATGLYQDRYALRTASQWIGPQLEDLLHARSQLTIELNSTTDNPLIDVESNHILHGGNFQAAVVTSTMDRTRLCLERFGKMMFSQVTEIINNHLNNGLPANLAADDPSLSYTCKGIDINMASYMSELGVLSNPVNAVQSAEMHNQSLNSLALISARYTLQALDVVYLMSAAFLYALCQALDLRVLQLLFLHDLRDRVQVLLKTRLKHDSDILLDAVLNRISTMWSSTTTMDLHDRSEKVADAVLIDVVKLSTSSATESMDIQSMQGFAHALKVLIHHQYNDCRAAMFEDHIAVTTSFLGNASKRMYRFVRVDLGIKMHRGLVEHPTQPLAEGEEELEGRKTIGSRISVIYEALRDGRVTDVVIACAEEAHGADVA